MPADLETEHELALSIEGDYAFVDYGDALFAVIVGERFPNWQLLGANREAERADVMFGKVGWHQGRPIAFPPVLDDRSLSAGVTTAREATIRAISCPWCRTGLRREVLSGRRRPAPGAAARAHHPLRRLMDQYPAVFLKCYLRVVQARLRGRKTARSPV
jgi:hypothetical protein